MTPDERELIQNVGGSMLILSLAQLPTICLCYGVFAPVSMLAAHRFFVKLWWRGRSAVSKAQLVIMPLAVIALTGNLVVQIRAAALYFDFFRGGSPLLLERAYSINILLAKIDVVLSWLQFIPPVLNDAFIIWRAWIVFERRRWALYLSIVMCLSSSILALVYLSVFSNPNKLLAYSLIGNSIQSWLSLATSLLAFMTNLVATSFISWTLWNHMKVLRDNMSAQQMRHYGVWRVLMILVDTGVIYGILQVVILSMSIAVHVDNLAGNISLSVVAAVYHSVSFVYPSLTIFLIHGPFSVSGVHDVVKSFDETSTRP